MFVYLAFTGDQIELPLAVKAESDDVRVTFRDNAGEIVALFPHKSVAVYSETPIESSDGVDGLVYKRKGIEATQLP